MLVVDDGSVNHADVASVTRRHGATLLAHPRNQGPAAARNTGLRHARTGYIAFCDSDVLPEPGWLGPLLAQFTDPALALAAPRVVGIPTAQPGWLDRYEDVRSPLDMGGREAPVVPLSALAYVPGATLVVRRAAVGGGFSPELRIGEDVDLCLRLHRAGWRMRYLPSSRVGHCHRASLRSWLAQRASYGSGAAGLALRHPGQVPPLHASAWSVAACALVLRGRPVPIGVATGLTACAALRLIRRIPDADTPVRAGTLLTLAAVRGSAEQLTGCTTRHYWPVAASRGIAEPTGTIRARQLRRDRGADRLPAERFEPEPTHLPDAPAPRRYGLRRGPMAWRNTPPHHRTLGPAIRPAHDTPGPAAAARRAGGAARMPEAAAPAPGLEADHARRGYPPGTLPGHHGHGGAAAAGPGAGFGWPQRVPGLVLEAEVRPGRRR